MSKRKALAKPKKSSAFVLRIKRLPEDAQMLRKLDDGTVLYADKFGTIYAERRETVIYRLLQGTL